MSDVKRIAIYGPESTGKTTLAQRLAAHYGEPWVPEYVRGFWDTHGGRVTGDDLDEIARGQLHTEDEATAKARRAIFCDTDLLTNVLWDDLLFPGKIPAWLRSEAERRARNYALYLFCDTDIAFADDPQRSFPDAKGREMCRRLWRETLEQRSLPFVEIKGDWTRREALAIQAVDAVLAAG